MGLRESSIFVFFSSPKLIFVLVFFVFSLSANLRLISRASHGGVLISVQESNLTLDLVHLFHQDSAPSNLHTTREPLSNDTYSACLLIMDDNFRLPEWLAYHYFALDLRYLVVAVDPESKTSPTTILDRFRTRMEIIEWTDRDFTTQKLHRRENASDDWNIAQHRSRQKLFYTSCTRHLKNLNRRWTAYIDTDEFITINEGVISDAQQRIHQPGGVSRLLEELRNDVNGTIQNSDFYRQNRACYTIPRRLYTAVESSTNEVTRNVTLGFDPVRFDTLRYRYRAINATQRYGFCKSLVDVSTVPDKFLGFNQIHGSAHRPFRSLCPSQWVEYTYPVGIHHYIGSLESFTHRDDARKNYAKSADLWKKRAMQQRGGSDDEIRPWLDGFVKFVGQSAAAYLLQGAGVLTR